MSVMGVCVRGYVCDGCVCVMGVCVMGYVCDGCVCDGLCLRWVCL